MDITQLRTIIAAGESLTVEFKGEEHGSLSDREIYEAVVCFANTDGGTLLIGVEDDHRITGAHPRHGTSTDPSKLQAAIFNNTEPHQHEQMVLGYVPSMAGSADQMRRICAVWAAFRQVGCSDV